MEKTLTEAKKGETCEIIKFSDEYTKFQLMRLGLAVGQIIQCLAKIGSVVIGKNRQKLAIGHHLAQKIIIRVVQA